MSAPRADRIAPEEVRRFGISNITQRFASHEEFRRSLLAERARTDRSGRPFSLVMHAIELDRDPGDASRQRRHAHRGLWRRLTGFWRRLGEARVVPDEVLAARDTILGRARQYDTVALLRPGTLALLLPETSAEGAWRVVEQHRKALFGTGVRVESEVYAYPHQHDAAPLGRLEVELEGVAASEVRDSDDDDSSTPPSDRGSREVEPSVAGGGRDSLDESGEFRREDLVGGSAHAEASAEAAIGTKGPVHDLSQFFLQEVGPLRRIVDVAVSGSALLVLSPVFAAVAIAVKLTSPGPVFYSQLRSGLGGRPFWFHKFRSMRVDADQIQKELAAKNEQSGPIFKMRDDPRMTKIGRILRRTSVDEFPQLWNVLRGDMTLVGPRPPRPTEVMEYELWQRRRLERPGGLTCIWQVSGRSTIGFQDWMRMDLRYINQRTAWLDVSLLWRTFSAVLSRRGAY